jgi:4-amino-4-deoxy-L-arabinose transferase-like glycosyltransferase
VTPISRKVRRPPVWLVALLVFVAFAFQGTRGIWEPDEGRYSSAGVNMHESGDWLVPTLDREHPHLTKPPMTYWALATSFALLGHNEWGARLPAALAYIGTGLFIFGLGRRFCPSRPWLPATVWGLSFAPVIAANVVSTDPVLVFFETAAMYAFVEAWSRDGADARRWYLAMWLGWALAFLTKGPPGLLPLLAVIAFVVLHDRGKLRGLFAPAGLLLFVAVASSWFVLVIAQEPDRLGYFLGYEVYDRVFTRTHDRNSEWYGPLEIYLPVLLVGALPWGAIALRAAGGPRAAWRLWRERLRDRDRDWLLLAWWLLLPLVVFCLARSRLQLYILPLFVPIALMLSRPLVRWHESNPTRFRNVAVATTLVLVMLKGLLAYWPADRDARDFTAQLARVVDVRTTDEIVFVDMRPFYGLNLYIDRRIEGIGTEESRLEYSKFTAQDTLCDEIAERELAVYAMKAHRADRFLVAARRCGAQPVYVGQIHADDNDIRLYTVELPTPAPAR